MTNDGNGSGPVGTDRRGRDRNDDGLRATAAPRSPRRGRGGAPWAGRAVRRSQWWLVLWALSKVVLVWMAGTSVGDWGGSPAEFMRAQFTNAPFITCPWFMGVGVLCGQMRWRAGLNQWDRRPPGARLRTCGNVLGGAAVIVVAAHATLLVLGLVAASYGALADGVAVPRVLADIVLNLPSVLAGTGLAVAVAVIGAAVGWAVSRLWIAPVMVVVTLILSIAASFVVGLGDRDDRLFAVPVDDLVCAGEAPRVCAHPSNVGYLDAGLRTIGEVYGASPYRDLLPGTVYLTDEPVGDRPETGADYPAQVQLMTHRGFTAPDSLDASAAWMNLLQSVGNACGQPLSPTRTEVISIINNRDASPADIERNRARLPSLLGSCPGR
ncbi:hypothetical protein MTQ22_10610 [Corynebacterium bovis]|uniref:hypothetical protein n=1 Tax=Corynebacterium bovis TaxID=36808 RepID=UPI003139FD3B